MSTSAYNYPDLTLSRIKHCSCTWRAESNTAGRDFNRDCELFRAESGDFPLRIVIMYQSFCSKIKGYKKQMSKKKNSNKTKEGKLVIYCHTLATCD